MKKFAAAALLTISTSSMAGFPTDPTIIYEGAAVMTINDPQKPAVLIYPCNTCAPLKMFFSPDSRILINGTESDVSALMKSTRWQADIFAAPDQPDVITKISTF